MMEKIKKWCVYLTAGNEDFNNSHPWYCVFTVFVVIGASIWAIADYVWRWLWARKN